MALLKKILDSENTYVFAITLVLSTLLLGYAFGSISLGLFLGVCYLNVFFVKPKFIRGYSPLLLIFSLVLLSLIWTIDLDKSVKGLSKFLPLLMVPCAFMCIPKLNRTGIDKIFDYFATSNTVFALVFFINAVVRFLKNHDTSVFFYHELVALFDLNAIYVSSFFVLSYGYLVLKKNLNAITYIKASILFVAVILLSSKLVIFLLILMTAITFFQSHIKRTTKVIIVLLLLLGAIVILQTNTFKNRINEEFDKGFLEVLNNDDFSMNFYPWSGSSLRLFQLRVFSELLKEDKFLLTGYGVNAAQGKVVEKHKEYKLFEGFYHYNFHDQYVQVLAELGVFGLACLIAVLYLLLKQYYKTKNKMVLFVFLLFGTLFFTESYLCTQRGIIHFMVYTCLLLYPSYKFDNG